MRLALSRSGEGTSKKDSLSRQTPAALLPGCKSIKKRSTCPSSTYRDTCVPSLAVSEFEGRVSRALRFDLASGREKNESRNQAKHRVDQHLAIIGQHYERV